jgi:Cyclophilin type peptidyl-prolyl cis-trans isomerase/CLD
VYDEVENRVLNLSVDLASRIKYFNNCLFHNVQKDFIVQTGDPTGTGRGGMSINGWVLENLTAFKKKTRPNFGSAKLVMVGHISEAVGMTAKANYAGYYMGSKRVSLTMKSSHISDIPRREWSGWQVILSLEHCWPQARSKCYTAYIHKFVRVGGLQAHAHEVVLNDVHDDCSGKCKDIAPIKSK